ncbi:hypothetical protein HHI36_019593, partial [Cryptolaemus montrouzieri]
VDLEKSIAIVKFKLSSILQEQNEGSHFPSFQVITNRIRGEIHHKAGSTLRCQEDDRQSLIHVVDVVKFIARRSAKGVAAHVILLEISDNI